MSPSTAFPELSAPNVWPEKTSLPGFQQAFEELCTLVIDTAVFVARACDRYASAYIDNYEPGCLERMVSRSQATKARLLHYFPPRPPSLTSQDAATYAHLPDSDASDHDLWCATHIDHGCLTGLTSAIYLDESAHSPRLTHMEIMRQPFSLPILPFLTAPPDPNSGLYIHARDDTVTKVSIPSDCLGFQTGEALQIITGGMFRAVPHFVRSGALIDRKMRVARNTLAVFTQPELGEIIDSEKGTTFGEFSREVVGRFG